MSFRLRSYDVNPPGGFCFQEPGFARQCLPMIDDIARNLSAFRKGNGRPRSSIQECLRDVDSYQCQRLGNNGTWCIESGKNAAGTLNPVALSANAPLVAPPCHGCGVVVQ
jgi:hypothetical protein